MDLARQGKTGGCAWYVSDAESMFCFFKLAADNGKPMPPHKIAQKLLIDDQDVKKIVSRFKKIAADLIEKDQEVTPKP